LAVQQDNARWRASRGSFLSMADFNRSRFLLLNEASSFRGGALGDFIRPAGVKHDAAPIHSRESRSLVTRISRSSRINDLRGCLRSIEYGALSRSSPRAEIPSICGLFLSRLRSDSSYLYDPIRIRKQFAAMWRKKNSARSRPDHPGTHAARQTRPAAKS